MDSVKAYEENAEALAVRYGALDFDDVHRSVRDLFLAPPFRLLDIGAGEGRDAAAFADLGCAVVAAEPVSAFRAAGQKRYPSPNICWVDTRLPNLDGLEGRFDQIMLTAVWMHLEPQERTIAMDRISKLIAPSGRLFLLVRHGPVPEGRKMFEISTDEIIETARGFGFSLLRQLEEESIQEDNRKAGVTWTRLAFEAPPPK